MDNIILKCVNACNTDAGLKCTHLEKYFSCECVCCIQTIQKLPLWCISCGNKEGLKIELVIKNNNLSLSTDEKIKKLLSLLDDDDNFSYRKDTEREQLIESIDINELKILVNNNFDIPNFKKVKKYIFNSWNHQRNLLLIKNYIISSKLDPNIEEIEKIQNSHHLLYKYYFDDVEIDKFTTRAHTVLKIDDIIKTYHKHRLIYGKVYKFSPSYIYIKLLKSYNIYSKSDLSYTENLYLYKIDTITNEEIKFMKKSNKYISVFKEDNERNYILQHKSQYCD